MGRKVYSLIYRKNGEETKRLYESESLKEVEGKKIDYSFDYNTDFLFIEEIWIGKTVGKDYDEEEEDSFELTGKDKLILSFIAIGMAVLGSIIKKKLQK